jgi:hypothetical protein
MKWISFEDQLPAQWQQIIVYIPDFGVSKDFMATSIYINKDNLMGATHWMPLPKPPKDEK